jgi:hypothetical protein
MYDRGQWIGAGSLVVVAMVLGAFAYDNADSVASAIGYGIGVGLSALVVTAVVRFVYLWRSPHRGQPFWTPDVLAAAGTGGMIAVIIIVLAGTAG